MTDSAKNGTNAGDLSQIKIFVGFMAAVVGVIILRELRAIFAPLSMALLLYFFFNGVVKRLLKLRIPRTVVFLFLLVFIFILFYFFGALVYYGVSTFMDRFPVYSARIAELAGQLLGQLKIPIADFNQYLEAIDWSQSIDTAAVTRIVSATFGSFAGFIGNLMLVLIFLMFMLAGRPALTGRLNRAFNSARADKIKYIINSIEDQVQQYLLIKTVVSLLTGFIGGLILFAGRFDLVIFSALLIFVLNFIPSFGSILATLFPMLIGFLKFGFSMRLLLVTLGLMLTQFIIGNILEPRITGRSLNLSPIVILISLIFWGYVWGIVGMVLAVPLTSALKIFMQNIPTLKPIAELISSG